MDIESDILLQIYDLADLIINSEEMKKYKEQKVLLDQDQDVLKLKRRLNQDKILFDEAERFGHFHPNYHEAKEKMEKAVKDLESNSTVVMFKQAEEALDELLYLVSSNIAQSISKSIMVPRNDGLNEGSSCGVGSCNSCGISGSCAI